MIRCTNCTAYLPDELFNIEKYAPCPICKSLVRADVFPAAYKSIAGGTSGELLLMDDESSCYYHANKQAVTSCSYCGRFLCSLCDIDFNDQHICVSCLESGKKKKKIGRLEDNRIRYDNVTLGLAIFPILMWYLSFLTAPTTVFLVIRYWNKPSGIVRKSKLRMLIALILALLQITAWGLYCYFTFIK